MRPPSASTAGLQAAVRRYPLYHNPALGRGGVWRLMSTPTPPVKTTGSVPTDPAVIANVITKFRLYEKRPMAELDGIDVFQWWTTNLEGLVRIVRAAGFSRVEPAETFNVP